MTDDRSSSVSQWGDAKRRGVVHSGGGIRNKSTTQAKHSEALNGQGELRTVHRTRSLSIPGRLQTHLGSFYLFHNHCVNFVGHIVLCSTR